MGGGGVSVARRRVWVWVWVWVWWCFFIFALAIITTSSARHIVSFSGNKMALVDDQEDIMLKKMTILSGGRSLKAHLDDYNDPSANTGHEPRNKHQAGGNRKN